MRIPSGVTDQYIYFVAVDATDFQTREPGLSSFTVYRSRNGGASTAMTTPTINETDTTNMPGVYELLADEDMTLDAGDDSQEMVFHITHAGMAPVTRVIELYRPKITAGETLTVSSGVGSANAVQVSGDSVAADNLEAMFDGTGYTDDTGPSSRAQVDAISVTGAAVNVSPLASPNGFVLTTGSEVNTEDSVVALDGTRHELTDTTGTLDCYYVFDVASSDVPTSVTFTGVFNGSNDSFDIFVNTGSSGTPTWSQRGTIAGTNNSANVSHTFTLFAGDKLSDDTSRVWVRIQATGLSSSSFDVDQVYVSKSISTQSVGYDDGAVWLDTNASNTATENFVDGVADNPVSTIAAARTIAESVGLQRIRVLPGSSFTLAASMDNYSIVGNHYSMDLGNQSISNAAIIGATITGGTSTATVAPIFEECIFDTAVTLPRFIIRRSFLGATITAGTAGNFFLNDCRDRVAGSGTPTFAFGAGTGEAVTNLVVRDFRGGFQINQIGVGNASDDVSFNGEGRLILDSSCTGGTLIYHGLVQLTDNSATTTVTEGAVLTRAIVNAEADTALTDYDPPTNAEMEARTLAAANYATAAGVSAVETDTQDIQSRLPAALVGGKMDSDATAISGSTTAADNLEESTEAIITGTAQTGTLSTTACTTDLTGFADDELINRQIVFKGGTANGQAATITDYASASGLVTFSGGIATAPANADPFVVV